MSEEEIIYILKQRIERKTVSSDPYYITQKAIEGLLGLYNKEKEKNKTIKERIEYYYSNGGSISIVLNDIEELLEERN